MGSLTDYAELELLDHVCNASYSPVATLYLALATADPTDAATGASMNECADANNYSRKAIAFNTASSRKVTQNGAVTYDQASGSWGTVTHWAITDNSGHGLGNVLAHGAFNESKAVVNGNTPSVADTEIEVEFSAGEISNFLALELLDHMFNNASYTSPDTYIALTTATVSDSDTGTSITEVSGGSYARVQVNVNGGSSPTWDVAAAGIVDNTHAIDFTTSTASWGTVTSVCVCSAATLGDLLFYDNTMADQLVGNGDTVSFPIGDLDIVMS
jgi:hypothetical protein